MSSCSSTASQSVRRACVTWNRRASTLAKQLNPFDIAKEPTCTRHEFNQPSLILALFILGEGKLGTWQQASILILTNYGELGNHTNLHMDIVSMAITSLVPRRSGE